MDYRREKIPGRTGAWIALILGSIVALASVFFWLPFWRQCQALDHNVMAAIQANMEKFAIYVSMAAIFLVFSIIASVKFSRAGKFWGPSFSGFLGRFIILLEYAAYAFSVVALFML